METLFPKEKNPPGEKKCCCIFRTDQSKQIWFKTHEVSKFVTTKS